MSERTTYLMKSWRERALQAERDRQAEEDRANENATLVHQARAERDAAEERLRGAYSLGAWSELVEERNKARALMLNAEGVAAGETYLREQAEQKLAMVKGLLAAYGDPEAEEEPPFEFLVHQIEAVLSDSDRVCGCEGDDCEGGK